MSLQANYWLRIYTVQAMNSLKFSLAVASTLLLAGCSVQDVAATAADAAACRALSSTLSGLSSAYESGLVDSGVIDQLDQLVGKQVDFLLSTELADSIRELAGELGKTDSAQGTSTKIQEITADIAQKCSEYGIELSN